MHRTRWSTACKVALHIGTMKVALIMELEFYLYGTGLERYSKPLIDNDTSYRCTVIWIFLREITNLNIFLLFGPSFFKDGDDSGVVNPLPCFT